MFLFKNYYVLSFFLVFLLSCGESENKVSSEIRKGIDRVSNDKKENITKIEYYKDYKQSYDGKTSYIGLIDEDEAKGIRHIRLYHSARNIIREEEYDKGAGLVRYTKPVYSSSGKRLSERWYDKRDNIILERFYRGASAGEDITFSNGIKSGKIKYIYDTNNILVKEEHYNTHRKLLFYKEFEYSKGLLVRSHFYSPDGSKVSTHKEYYESVGRDDLGSDLSIDYSKGESKVKANEKGNVGAEKGKGEKANLQDKP